MGILHRRDLFTRIRPRSGAIAWALPMLVLAALICAVPAPAQTTSGTIATGNTLFNTTFNCHTCHTANSANRYNAINAGGHISHANSQNMGGSVGTAQNYADIAAYLSTQFTAAGTQNIPYNSGGVAFAIPNFALGTSLGGYTNLSVVSAPSKGSVSFIGTTATYTPTSGQSGADSFTYQANRPGGTSNVRSQSINIVNPTPTNDLFNNGIFINGGHPTLIGTNVGASKEVGEQATYPNNNAGGKSVWWIWRAPSTNPVTISTAGSTFDTMLEVLTGFAVNGLTPVAFNDDFNGTTQSSVTFNATEGIFYKIVVDGYSGASGTINLDIYQLQSLTAGSAGGGSGTITSSPAGINCPVTCTADFAPGTVVTLTATPANGSQFAGWSGSCSGYGNTCQLAMNAALSAYASWYVMPNDNFANATVVNPAFPFNISGYNIGATAEAGEPPFLGRGRSIWWSWTAPRSRTFYISTCGSDFDTVLGIYTGSAVNALTAVGTNDDFCGLQSSVTFNATAGTTYYIGVDGYAGATGNVQLSFGEPGADYFDRRLALTGGTVTELDTNVPSGNNNPASKETGEPVIHTISNNAGGASMWYSWIAPTTNPVTISTCGSSFDTLLGVYTGGAVNALTNVAGNDDSCGLQSSVTFSATAGTQYQIVVDGYSGATGNIVLNILQQEPQTISFANPGAQSFSSGPLMLSATATSLLTVVFGSSTPAICTVAGSNVTFVTVGTCTIVASQAGNASFFAAPNVQQSFSILQGSQSISFGAQSSQVFSNGGMAMVNPLASATSGLPISYSSNSPGVCTVAGSTVSMVATGSCSISANQAGNANYAAAAPVTQVFAINPGPQTITFGAQGGQSYAPSGSFAVNPPATSTSGLTVAYSSTTPGVCSVAGTNVTIVSAGTCTIAANQAGNANFNPAVQVTQNVAIAATAPGAPTIGMATPGNTQASIAFTPPANTGGVAITGYTATCNPGAIAASNASSPITVATLTNNTPYTCSVKANNAAMLTGVASGTVMVTPAATPVAPNITSLNATTFTVLSAGNFTVTATGTPTPTLSLMGSLPTGVTFTPGTGALAGTPVTGTAGSYPVTITATNASGMPMQAFTLTVQKASQTISFGNPGAQSFNPTPVALTASASPSMLTVAFSSNTPATCSVSGASFTMLAVGSCTIVANQTGNADYSAATPVQQTFSIGTGSQTINFMAQTPSSRAYAPSASFAINPLASATSGLAVTYSSTTLGVCTVSGSNVTMVASGTCTIAANQAGNASYTAASQATSSLTINGSTPGAPTIGTATPSDTQASIAFTPPANTGGSAITNYTATCNPNAITGSGASSPVTVSGLVDNTSYTCSVTATNAATLTSAPSSTVMVTPLTTAGITTWNNICTGCHTPTPSGHQLNGGGSTSTVLDYVILHQPAMSGNANVTGLTQNQRAAVAAYILSVEPAVTATTPYNTGVPVDVASNLTLNTPTGTFTSVEAVASPTNGTLGAFTGTVVTYTPNNGFIGTDTFTYRGKNMGAALLGDPRTVTITVLPPVPAISSAATATGTFNAAFNYQIAASNSPTSYGATGLPAGLGINTGTGLISGTPGAAGFSTVMISATNGGGTGSAALSLTINKAAQIIVFPAQAVPSRSFSGGAPFPANPLASGGATGNAIVYGSSTTGVCTVSGTTATIVAAGTCTLTADQAGNANYLSAPTATQGVTITPVAPGAPVIGTATPGDSSVTIGFTPPANTGGTAITSYAANCSPSGSGTSASSPILVSGLGNGTTYTCTVNATGPGGTSTNSGSVMVTPTQSGVAPNITSANATTFTVLSAGTFTVTAVGTPTPTLSLMGALPTGVSFTPGTGALAGTPATGTVGSYPVTITASNASGMPTQMFTLTVQKASQTINFGNPGAQSFSPTPVPLTASASPSMLTVAFSSNTPATCSVSGATFTMIAVGSCTIVANQTGNADYSAATPVQQTFSIGTSSQTITFPAQSVPARSYAPSGTFAINPLAAASSGLAVTYSSNTPSVCTVSGTNVTMMATGTCMIAADQAGNANYTPAPQVTSSVTITVGVPGAPAITSATPGDTNATIAFTAPANNGGSSITQYTATCGAVSVIGASSPILVGTLTNNNSYTCTVKASNAVGTGPDSAGVMVTPLLRAGTALWTQICTACHTATPSGVQLNGGGSTPAVLNYVIANQSQMTGTPSVFNLTQNERSAIAAYILSVEPPVSGTTPFNTQLPIDVASNLTLNTLTGSFTSVESVASPTHGMLSVFNGTMVTYTPNPGYVGADSFTYRGKNIAQNLLGDARTVNITVSPPPVPVITSPATATGTNGVAFNYQIGASNTPMSYAAMNLPSGLAVNAMSGVISGTPTVGGIFGVTISATNAGGTGSANLMLTLNPGAQAITFPAQLPATHAYSPNPSNTFAISPLATSSSGLTVTYASNTQSVCTVSGTTVTMLTAGNCTIGANQAGDANFTIATEVTQSVSITPTIPGAPTIGAGTPGNNQATIAFTPPANTGGTAITLYSASCTPAGMGTNTVSPIVVGSLTNGTTYTCSVTASNSVGPGLASITVAVTPAPTPTAPLITSANATSFTVNAPGSFSVTATGTPASFTYSEVGTLPTGVTFSTSTGILSGTPTQGGTFPLTFGVSNGVLPNASLSFTLTVANASQTITFNNPGTQVVGAGVVALSAVATSSLTVMFVSDTTGVCAVAGTNLTLVSVGTCTIRAQQSGNANFSAAPDVPQSFSVVQGSQTITFGAQTTSSRAFVASSMFGLSPTASASSGLAIAYSSLTTGVCTIASTTVTMVRAGICTIAANQGGNASFGAAAQVTQAITFTGSAPGAPTIGTVTAGDKQITVTFSAPANDGGLNITSYTVNCGGVTQSGGASPIVVTGLTNGVSYSCSVTATNAINTGPASGSLMATANALPGATVWATTGSCGGCHGSPPVGTRLNVGGATSAVLDYVVAHPTLAMNSMVTIVGTLSAQQKTDVAVYIRDFIPAVSATTPANTAVDISVVGQVFLNTAAAQLTSLQQVVAPTSGALSAFTGTTVTYTPNPGFVGTDTFTYRATQPMLNTDTRTVSVTVTPAMPAITSALTVSATLGQSFSYQIAATNAPTSYDATGLPTGLGVNMATGVISGMPSVGGTTMETISAMNAGGTGNATLAITVNLISQSITFGAQPSPITYAQGGVVMISPTATGGLSGNPIIYSSTTTGVCSVSGSTFTIITAGICTIAANQAGNGTYAAAAQVTRSVLITGVAPAAPTLGAAVAGNTQATINFTPSANTGGLPITSYTAVCNGIAVNGPSSPIVVSGLTNGVIYTCTVTATNAAGTSAPSGSVMVTPVSVVVPGAPTIGVATPGNNQAMIAFMPPAVDGGGAIIDYTATCNPGNISATNAVSPVTVTGLVNSTAYSCSVTARNSAGSGSASTRVSVTPLPALALASVVSRKNHGAAGSFDLTLNSATLIGGAVDVESRTIGTGHTLVFTFNNPVTAAGNVGTIDSLSATVGSASSTNSGNNVVVTLTGIPDNKRVTVTLTNVNGVATPFPVSLGFLVGDVNNTRSVNASDISAVKANLNSSTNAANFRMDVNANGTISATDVSAVKARSGSVLPP